MIDQNLPYRFLRGQPLKSLLHLGQIGITFRTLLHLGLLHVY